MKSISLSLFSVSWRAHHNVIMRLDDGCLQFCAFTIIIYHHHHHRATRSTRQYDCLPRNERARNHPRVAIEAVVAVALVPHPPTITTTTIKFAASLAFPVRARNHSESLPIPLINSNRNLVSIVSMMSMSDPHSMTKRHFGLLAKWHDVYRAIV